MPLGHSLMINCPDAIPVMSPPFTLLPFTPLQRPYLPHCVACVWYSNTLMCIYICKYICKYIYVCVICKYSYQMCDTCDQMWSSVWYTVHLSCILSITIGCQHSTLSGCNNMLTTVHQCSQPQLITFLPSVPFLVFPAYRLVWSGQNLPRIPIIVVVGNLCCSSYLGPNNPLSLLIQDFMQDQSVFGAM